MSDNFTITSIDEWLDLNRIECPKLQSDQESGSVFTVKKVGFVLVSPDECSSRGINAPAIPGGKSALPTAVVQFDKEFELCSLPLELFDWVEGCVSMAHAGINPFPIKVEFGVLDGRYYAEVL
jgi:hypothetical protein